MDSLYDFLHENLFHEFVSIFVIFFLFKNFPAPSFAGRIRTSLQDVTDWILSSASLEAKWREGPSWPQLTPDWESANLELPQNEETTNKWRWQTLLAVLKLKPNWLWKDDTPKFPLQPPHPPLFVPDLEPNFCRFIIIFLIQLLIR